MTSDGSSLRGRRWETGTPDARQMAARLACDYRGDVTFVLADGTSVTGYAFSHVATGASAHVRLLTASSEDVLVVPLDAVTALEITGDDKADGRSWRAWVERYEDKKRRLAEGLEVDDIEPRAETLD